MEGGAVFGRHPLDGDIGERRVLAGNVSTKACVWRCRKLVVPASSCRSMLGMGDKTVPMAEVDLQPTEASKTGAPFTIKT